MSIECPLCEGEGGEDIGYGQWDTCRECNGNGRVELHDSGVYSTGFALKCKDGSEYSPGHVFSEEDEDE